MGRANHDNKKSKSGSRGAVVLPCAPGEGAFDKRPYFRDNERGLRVRVPTILSEQGGYYDPGKNEI